MMTAILQRKAYIQQQWTDQALLADEFLSYRAVKRITMARMLLPDQAPKIMKIDAHTIIDETGYWVVYVAGETVKTMDDYKPRSIEPTIFAKTYRPWDVPNRELTLTEVQLQRFGCQPYYKIMGVWAKRVTNEIWVQSLEGNKPLLAPKGTWLCIGSEGEPWSMTDVWFQAHYRLPGSRILQQG